MAEQISGDQIQFLLSDFNTRLRDIDEKSRLIRERVLLLGKNLIALRNESENEIRSLKKENLEIRNDLEKLKGISRSLLNETNKFVKYEEIRLIERMLKDFQPLEFMRKKDVEELIKEKLAEKEIKEQLPKNKMALDKVLEMQKQGMSTNEIVSQLRQEGHSPFEINNALNQASVKSAVDSESFVQPSQESIMSSQPQTPAPQELQMQQEWSNQVNEEFNSPGQEYYPQMPQSYSGQDYYPEQNATNLSTETISEIAEQVVQEKFSEFTKKTGDLVAFKNAVQDKLVNLDERLKRIENSIDKLQSAIIGKIGEFGESTNLIHQDLENLHGTVAKLMNPLVDNYNELKKIARP